jgi:anti-sigma regulatory factor (Ser/Thr protein kinase)
VVPELDEEFNRGTLHTLRAKVLAQACRAGLSESRAADVVLAVHELAANAISHGAGAGRLRVWKLVRQLCCQVDDGDPPRENPAWHPGGSVANTADAFGQTVVTPMSYAPGHGLWLVRRVADRIGTVSGPGGTRVRVAFNLPCSG